MTTNTTVNTALAKNEEKDILLIALLNNPLSRVEISAMQSDMGSKYKTFPEHP